MLPDHFSVDFVVHTPQCSILEPCHQLALIGITADLHPHVQTTSPVLLHGVADTDGCGHRVGHIVLNIAARKT